MSDAGDSKIELQCPNCKKPAGYIDRKQYGGDLPKVGEWCVCACCLCALVFATPTTLRIPSPEQEIPEFVDEHRREIVNAQRLHARRFRPKPHSGM